MTSYQRVLRQAAHERLKKKQSPYEMPRNAGIRGRSYFPRRPTENDAADSIRTGRAILANSYGQSIAWGLIPERAVYQYPCVHCGQTKDIAYFSPDVRKRNGLDSWCCDCRAERRRELREMERAKRIQKVA